MIQRKKVGGITFLAIGRLRLSYCVAKAPAPAERSYRTNTRGQMLAVSVFCILSMFF